MGKRISVIDPSTGDVTSGNTTDVLRVAAEKRTQQLRRKLIALASCGDAALLLGQMRRTERRMRPFEIQA